ncbi:hypothetical protein ACIQD3_08945 [Peribacillus loiseleuriae]|uniref:hypothetical protein n=1 Tax=Peribacillus loiseleuriae TaxID=1679170 RepID=UPI0037F16158
MTYFNFGSLTIPAIWLAASTALILAALFNRVVARERVGDWYWNGFILYFLVWKLSYIVFNLNMFLDIPLSLVYFNGGAKGHILALSILSFYLLFIAVKKHPSINGESAQLFLLYFICYEVVINTLEQSVIETLIHFILLTGYLFLLYFLKKKKITLSSQMFIVMVMLELLIFSLFHSFDRGIDLLLDWHYYTYSF